jgi:hypothetical protein
MLVALWQFDRQTRKSCSDNRDQLTYCGQTANDVRLRSDEPQADQHQYAG